MDGVLEPLALWSLMSLKSPWIVSSQKRHPRIRCLDKLFASYTIRVPCSSNMLHELLTRRTQFDLMNKQNKSPESYPVPSLIMAKDFPEPYGSQKIAFRGFLVKRLGEISRSQITSPRGLLSPPHPSPGSLSRFTNSFPYVKRTVRVKFLALEILAQCANQKTISMLY